MHVFQFLNYLQNSGVDVYYYVNLLHELLGLPQLTPPSLRAKLLKLNRGQKGDLGGLKGFLDSVVQALPVDQIHELVEEKLQSSEEFAEFVEQLRSDDFKRIVDRLVSNEKFQEMIEKAREDGIDVDAIKEFLNDIFGWFV